MSDQHFDGSLPELTPEQESDVRRLLADARHDEPIPVEVADRLDAVLAGLSRDEPGSEGVAPVIDLAARRRRNAAAVLAGAAAVIVAGFGIGQIIDVGSQDSGESSTAANADRAGAGDDQSSTEDQQLEATGGASATKSEPAVPGPDAPVTLLRLRSDHLESDVTRQLRSYTYTASSVRAPGAKDFYAAGCPLPPSPQQTFGLGRLFPALFDGSPAVLALRPPADGSQQADVLDCTTADSLASVTIPSR